MRPQREYRVSRFSRLQGFRALEFLGLEGSGRGLLKSEHLGHGFRKVWEIQGVRRAFSNLISLLPLSRTLRRRIGAGRGGTCWL